MKKRTLALLLSLVMAIGLAAPAMAAEYTVVAGDSLSKIAEKTLGDVNRWKEIYEANKDTVKDPNKIYVGQKLTIPEAKPVESTKPVEEGKTLTATAAGYEEGEVVTVSMTVNGDKITAVTATSTHDSPHGKRALTLMPKAILEQNSVNVDAISGATATSVAIRTAAQKIMAQLTEEGNIAVDLDAWALANGYVKAADYNIVTGVDAITGATQTGVGGINFGPIPWSRELQEAAIKEFLKGGKYTGLAQDDSGYNYREMYQMATSFNNIPANANLELVLDTKSMHLVGVSESATGKVKELAQNPNVSLSWVRQLHLGDEENGYDYYCSYGVQINGKVKIYTAADLETSEGQDAAINCYEIYYATTPGTWGPYYAAFKDLTDPAEIRAAKLAKVQGTITGNSMTVYEVIPESIVITAPVIINMNGMKAHAFKFATVQDGEDKYAYDLGLTDAFLDKLVEYKAAFVATEEGKALVEAYYGSPMFAGMLDGAAKAQGQPTSLETALDPNSAGGLMTQTVWTPAQ